MDIYKRPLSPDEIILLYLKELINHNVDICKFILKIKKKLEKEEIMEWYIERWENIAGAHYILHDTHYEKFSLIYNENDYIVKPDHRLVFYNRIFQLLKIIRKIYRTPSMVHTYNHLEVRKGH